MSDPHNPFAHAEADTVHILQESRDFEPTKHRLSARERDALALAHAARRPLLVRGEPGSGKSQLARVAAKLMDAATPYVQVIDPRFEPRDLLYRYDTIRRLSDANMRDSSLKPDHEYVVKGVLWQAWADAAESKSAVVLIDEIDKGDADVPNSLLEVLGQRRFRVNEVPTMDTPELPAGAMPLVVITTNEERELPAAFVRRCVVLNLNPPAEEQALRLWLRERVDAHFGPREGERPLLAPDVIDLALTQVLADRRDAVRQGYPKVGLAEALDLLTALDHITRGIEDDAARAAEQHAWLARVSAYALVKHAGVNPGQSRLPVTAAIATAPEAD